MKEHYVICTATPLIVLLLLDLSRSMLDKITGLVGGEATKLQAAGLSLNTILYEYVVMARTSEGVIKDYMFVNVLGFGNEVVRPLLPPPLNTNEFHGISKIAEHTLRVENGQPVWVDPDGDGGTPMCQALNEGFLALSQRLDQHPEGMPPVCILLTDGEPTDGDPREAAERLKELASERGPVTLFPIAISSAGGEPVSFPSSPDVLPDEYSHLLFEMASPMPEYMREAARQQGFELNDQSRAMVYNADASALFKALRAGTIVLNTAAADR